ncbi:hypothetical protein PQR34_10515, partial [Paraburkholderia sediminicola]|uniref:hypothetical protein n=1 Tax=Paraburkholderia sediminicola TaxID=458836 RepID=UPI0038BBD07A
HLEKEIMRTAANRVATSMREKLGSIRHPETGEFPSVVVEGEDLRDMAFRIEGSPDLLQIVRDRMQPEELKSMTFVATEAGVAPRVFLSYGWEDQHLASKIAEGLDSGVTQRTSPSPSATPYGFGRGRAASISRTVRGTVSTLSDFELSMYSKTYSFDVDLSWDASIF